MLKNLRCGECARLLCKAGAFDEIQIKCPRCGDVPPILSSTPVWSPIPYPQGDWT
ncbi:Com family DNA-binding transcriptional regulator [Xanthomonas arboricola]|uniref:Com family DNA-binding transcriptional regulator n=1 Tax=Xanthomonas arboricola TaxID=56448 RepID=UPI002010D9A3|nr:Com family DNA-binding transcriptional regulator [Xanthomonas arboricola]